MVQVFGTFPSPFLLLDSSNLCYPVPFLWCTCHHPCSSFWFKHSSSFASTCPPLAPTSRYDRCSPLCLKSVHRFALGTDEHGYPTDVCIRCGSSCAIAVAAERSHGCFSCHASWLILHWMCSFAHSTALWFTSHSLNSQTALDSKWAMACMAWTCGLLECNGQAMHCR